MKPLSKEERGGLAVLLAAVVLLIGYGIWARGCVTGHVESASVVDTVTYSVAEVESEEFGDISHGDSRHGEYRSNHKRGKGTKRGGSGKRGKKKAVDKEEQPRDYLEEIIK